MNKKESRETIKSINLICLAVETAKQKTIKKVVKRLNQMSPNDVQSLARIIKAI